MSGTAVAATALVSGGRLIANHSLSGDRLRDCTVTERQIKALVWRPLTLGSGSIIVSFGAGADGGCVSLEGVQFFS